MADVKRKPGLRAVVVLVVAVVVIVGGLLYFARRHGQPSPQQVTTESRHAAELMQQVQQSGKGLPADEARSQ